MRPIMVKQYTINKVSGRPEYIGESEAVFHCWGTNFEEYESGPGNFTTAIVEYPDGRVDSVEVHKIRFTREEQNGTPS